jgi:hypothetical protein
MSVPQSSHKVFLDLETLGASATTGTLELPTLAGNVGLLLRFTIRLAGVGKYKGIQVDFNGLDLKRTL